MKIKNNTAAHSCALLLWLLLTSCDQPTDISFIGANQIKVIDVLGEPDEKEELVRNEEHVFGPIEDLWYKIELGEKIVIWKYKTSDGWKELYFLNDTTEVVGEFFWFNDLDNNPVF